MSARPGWPLNRPSVIATQPSTSRKVTWSSIWIPKILPIRTDQRMGKSVPQRAGGCTGAAAGTARAGNGGRSGGGGGRYAARSSPAPSRKAVSASRSRRAEAWPGWIQSVW